MHLNSTFIFRANFPIYGRSPQNTLLRSVLEQPNPTTQHYTINVLFTGVSDFRLNLLTFHPVDSTMDSKA